MRLTPEQQSCIRSLVREHFGDRARVTVFGSRVDDSRIGGDVDLLLELPQRSRLAEEIKLSAQLEDTLGIPVDVITTSPTERQTPIVEIARATGTML